MHLLSMTISSTPGMGMDHKSNGRWLVNSRTRSQQTFFLGSNGVNRPWIILLFLNLHGKQTSGQISRYRLTGSTRAVSLYFSHLNPTRSFKEEKSLYLRTYIFSSVNTSVVVLDIMVPKLMLLHMLIITTLASAQKLQIAKPGCKSLCGNVSIPYPFGMGSPSCFIGESFEISCRNSTTPFLRLTNDQELEVIRIDLERSSTITVKNPITFWNNGTMRQSQEAANLTGSPFVFSQKLNRFTAVSCGVLALMKSVAVNSSETVGACMSICDTSPTRETSCNGMNCCQTTIPMNLKDFTTELDRESRNREEKKPMYAFLVDQHWFQHTEFGKFSEIGKMETVPVVLEWRLYNWTRSNYTYGTKWRNSSTSHCIGDGASQGVQCFCGPGYEGNPYVNNTCRGKSLSNSLL